MWAGGEVMPTQIIQYQCNKCFQTYLNEQTAIDCESKHFELNDFEIVNLSKEKTPHSGFPGSIHVINQKNYKVASYIFNHNKIKPKSFKQEWLDHLDKLYKRPLKNHYGYRFDSEIFPSEEEDA